MAKPKGLGRGLDALLGGATPSQQAPAKHPDDVRAFPASAAVRDIDVADIEAHPGQPRMVFDEQGIKQLAKSIEQHGIIQPITLRRVRASKYQIISGERRFRAAQMAGLSALPAYVREADDLSVLEMALVENIQREDLNPLEVALSFQQLMSLNGWTQEELGKRVGKGRSTITNHLRVLDLPDAVQALIRSNALSCQGFGWPEGQRRPAPAVGLGRKGHCPRRQRPGTRGLDPQRMAGQVPGQTP